MGPGGHWRWRLQEWTLGGLRAWGCRDREGEEDVKQCVCLFVCVHAHMCIHVCACSRVHMCTHMQVYAHTCVCTLTCLHCMACARARVCEMQWGVYVT